MTILIHACGHQADWQGLEVYPEILHGLLRTYPCPWCGGEAGEPLEDKTTRVIFNNGLEVLPGGLN